ncbi:unnamed protein product [Closterium sp. NIES-54]
MAWWGADEPSSGGVGSGEEWSRWVHTGHNGGQVRVHTGHNGGQVRVHTGHNGGQVRVHTGHNGGQVRVHTGHNGGQVRVHTGHDGGQVRVHTGHNGGQVRVHTGHNGGQVRVHTVHNGGQVRVHTGHNGGQVTVLGGREGAVGTELASDRLVVWAAAAAAMDGSLTLASALSDLTPSYLLLNVLPCPSQCHVHVDVTALYAKGGWLHVKPEGQGAHRDAFHLRASALLQVPSPPCCSHALPAHCTCALLLACPCFCFLLIATAACCSNSRGVCSVAHACGLRMQAPLTLPLSHSPAMPPCVLHAGGQGAQVGTPGGAARQPPPRPCTCPSLASVHALCMFT